MDQLEDELRQRFTDDYALQKEAVNSILATFTASEGELAKSIAIRDEDREACEHYGMQGALRFKMHVTQWMNWGERRVMSMVYTLVYAPETGMVFVHEAVREGETPTEGMPIPAKHILLPSRHSFEGWSNHSDEDFETYFRILNAERLRNLVIRVEAGDEFATRKLVRIVDGKLDSVRDPIIAKFDMERSKAAKP